MKLSIITCTLNSEKYLEECINSVINQNLDIGVYEHIFVDWDSKDKTKDIVEKYIKDYSNVKIIKRKPKWVYNAMNEGIKEAKWKYIMCLNSDDYLVEGVLDKYLGFVEKTGNKDLYYGILNIVNNWVVKKWIEKFFRIKQFLFKNFWCNVLIFHPTCLVKRESLLEMQLFDEDKKIASDYWMRLKMLKSGKEICYYPNNISNFREWCNSLTTSNNKLAKEEVFYYQYKYFWFWGVLIAEILNLFLKCYWKITKILWKIIYNYKLTIWNHEK